MSEEVKRLQRSKTERILAGVCGGLGQYFDVDPTIIRVLFVFTSLFIGGGVLAYIVLWIIVPEELDAAEQTDEVPATEGE